MVIPKWILAVDSGHGFWAWIRDVDSGRGFPLWVWPWGSRRWAVGSRGLIVGSAVGSRSLAVSLAADSRGLVWGPGGVGC